MAACQFEMLAGCRSTQRPALAASEKFKPPPPMSLVEGEFPLTWFLTTALLSKPETKVNSFYTRTGDTAEGVYIFPGQSMST